MTSEVALDAAKVSQKHDLHFKKIDHIALAVSDLEQSVELFQNVMGFELKRRLHIKGKRSGMKSAEMEANGVRFVLCEGTESESQVSKLIENYGVGLAHVALLVEDVEQTVAALKHNGLAFDTNVIQGPGLTQAFSTRCPHTGVSFEIIARNGEDGFVEENVQQLFEQLEESGKY